VNAKIEPRDYTAKELAEKAGVTSARIRQLLLDGTLEGVKRGGAWFIPASVAQRWLDSRQNGHK